MKRSELITKLAALYESIPEGASSYHICDILVGYAEREGLTPPIYKKEIPELYNSILWFREWENEDEEV